MIHNTLWTLAGIGFLALVAYANTLPELPPGNSDNDVADRW